MTPRLLRPAPREYHTWTLDSRRLDAYRPRGDDIIISTYPKCGTTWTQRIVSMLVFRSPEPRPIHDVSPWPEMQVRGPMEAIVGAMEAQEHRRFIKAHLPLDGLPLYESVKYIHVARDGRDACLSWHNHQSAYTPEMLARLDQIGLEDPAIGRPIPRAPADPRAFFREWVSHGPGSPGLDFFAFEASWWDGRRLPDVLLVHYADLKADLAGEMRRIADFLGITIPDDLWPALVGAADFEAMKRDGKRLLPTSDRTFQGGADRFLHKGTNERWRGVLTEDDLALYEAKVCERFTPGLAAWVEGGRRATETRATRRIEPRVSAAAQRAGRCLNSRRALGLSALCGGCFGADGRAGTVKLLALSLARNGRPKATLKQSSGCCGNPADLGPHLECARPCGSILVGGYVVATEMEEVADLIMCG